MAWTNPKLNWLTNPTNPVKDDFNRIEGNIDFLKTDIETKKGAIVDAINTMGQTATLSDTHAVLGTKIKDISKDANAVATDAISGRTFYAGGVKRTGNRPDYGALSYPLSTSPRSLPAGFFSSLTIDPLKLYVGDITMWEDLSEISTIGASPSKSSGGYKKGQEMNYPGTVRVSFNLRTSIGGEPVSGQIFINDVAAGTIRTTTDSTWSTFFQDFNVAAGQQIDLRIWRNGNQGQTVRSNMFRIAGQFKNFTMDY